MKALLLVYLGLLTLPAFAQDSDTKIEVKGGVGGGSYYDVPSKTKLDKYGQEWVPSTSQTLEVKISNEDVGAFNYRALVMKDHEGRLLSDLRMVEGETRRNEFANNKVGSLFVRARLINYEHRDRLAYYKLDGNYVPTSNGKVNLDENIKFNQDVLQIAPEVGLCKNLEEIKLNNKLTAEGFAELSLRPIGVGLNQYKIEEVNSPVPFNGESYEAKSQLVAGGKFRIVGLVTYKEKLYLKVQFEQDYSHSLNDEQVSTANRRLQAQVGVNLGRNVAVHAGIENNELVIEQNKRSAIDVNNMATAGVTVTIPKKKR